MCVCARAPSDRDSPCCYTQSWTLCPTFSSQFCLYMNADVNGLFVYVPPRPRAPLTRCVSEVGRLGISWCKGWSLVWSGCRWHIQVVRLSAEFASVRAARLRWAISSHCILPLLYIMFNVSFIVCICARYGFKWFKLINVSGGITWKGVTTIGFLKGNNIKPRKYQETDEIWHS